MGELSPFLFLGYRRETKWKSCGKRRREEEEGVATTTEIFSFPLLSSPFFPLFFFFSFSLSLARAPHISLLHPQTH